VVALAAYAIVLGVIFVSWSDVRSVAAAVEADFVAELSTQGVIVDC